MKITEFYNQLKNLMPEPLAWDNDGLAFCPDGNAVVSRVLCALDVTLDTVNYAAEHGFDVILSHHPLLFEPPKSLTEDTAAGRRVLALARHSITAMSFHTRLDLMRGGVNEALFDRLGLKAPEYAGDDGILRVGEYESGMTAAEFAELVKKALGLPHIVYAGDREVRRVALIGGAGNETEDIRAAIDAGADTYLTGELKYHQLVDARDMGINLFAAGHFHTEFPAVAVLEKLAKQAAPGIYTEIYCSNRIEIS